MKKDKKFQDPRVRARAIKEPFSDKEERILSDVQGSYTGEPVDGGKPQQDADDL